MGQGGPDVPCFGMFSILYYNVRSVLLIMDVLAACVLVHKPNMVCIVESWLDGDVCQYEIILPNFVYLRLDKSRHEDGILLWIRDSIV